MRFSLSKGCGVCSWFVESDPQLLRSSWFPSCAEVRVSVYWWDCCICRVDVGICWDPVGHLGGSASVRSQIFQCCLFQLCSPPSKHTQFYSRTERRAFYPACGTELGIPAEYFHQMTFSSRWGCSLCLYSRNKALFEDSVATINRD